MAADRDSFAYCLSHTPHQAVHALRKLHESNDPAKRADFIYSYGVPLTTSQLEACIKSGMPQLLMDILLEEETYHFIDPPPPDEQYEYVNVQKIRYACYVMMYLERFLDYIWYPQKTRILLARPASIEKCSQRIMEKLPLLWDLYSRKRHIILEDPRVLLVPVDPGLQHKTIVALGIESFRDVFSEFVVVVFKSSKYIVAPPPIWSNEARFLLYCWLYKEGPTDTYHNFTYLMFHMLSSHGKPEDMTDLTNLLKTTLAGVTAGDSLLRQSFCRCLKDSNMKTVDVTQLMANLCFFVNCYPSFVNAESEDNLFTCILATCQRHLCSGKSPSDTDKLLMQALVCLRDIKDGIDDTGVFTRHVLLSPIGLLPILTRLWVPALRTANTWLITNYLLDDLDLQDDIWKRGRDQIVSGDFTDVLEGHARYTQNTWLHTLDDLLAVPSTPGSDLKAFIIKRWVKHGEIYGLDEATERHRFAAGVEPARSPLPSPMMPCHYSLCLCADHAASHRMRVCKGCWEVFYCCKNCQKNDWIGGGHRCSGRRRQSRST